MSTLKEGSHGSRSYKPRVYRLSQTCSFSHTTIPPMWVILASLPKGEMQSREASSLHLGQGARGGARVSGLRSFALSTLPVRGFPASMQELL